ncbi:hypothetical protein [Streptomyces chattanoogensis]|uniref:Uncharacterized protein n=1 Tax=Streptomyces chattanoogensis TaxID=66876 RepID=A0A0N0Y086_9ACTN|nr:hypothetical protein [Streptomyces chattanoogensis]KPC64675.1 hypothetical protein ADL29_10845 [Streptomyces chattanoogensis]
MSTWQRIRGTSDGRPTPGDLVWFADDPAADETWGHGYPIPGAEERAAHAWAATARTAAEAAGQQDVQVVGAGALARLVRLALPDDTDTGSLPQPGAVIETTGTTAGIKSALATVRPGGLVLLAARPLQTSTPLPTYHGIHLPGIRVLPVPWCDGVDDAPQNLVACFLRSVTRLSGRRGSG